MSRKTGKGKGKHFEDVNASRMKAELVEDTRFPNAYKKGTFVLAVMRNGVDYKLAEILEIRKAKSPDEDDFTYVNQMEEMKISEEQQENPK